MNAADVEALSSVGEWVLLVIVAGFALILVVALAVIFWPPTRRERKRLRDIEWWESQARARAFASMRRDPLLCCVSCQKPLGPELQAQAQDALKAMKDMGASRVGLVCSTCHPILMGDAEDIPRRGTLSNPEAL